MMTKFIRCLLGIFTFYLLIFSLIRKEYISYSDLENMTKLILILMITIVEFGIIVYSTCTWIPDSFVKDWTDIKEVVSYKRFINGLLFFIAISTIILILDMFLACSFYSGVFLIFVILTDLLSLIVFGASIRNFVACIGYDRRRQNEN